MFLRVGQFVEDEAGHSPRVVSALLQIGYDLTAQSFDLLARESGMTQDVPKDGKRQWQVFSQTLRTKSGGVGASADGDAGANCFQLLVCLLKGPVHSAARQCTGGEGG